MKIRCVNRQFVGLSSFCGLLLITVALCSVGCGSGESNEIAFSQNFEMPPGAKLKELPDSSLPAFNRQRKMREDDRKETTNKSKKRRP